MHNFKLTNIISSMGPTKAHIVPSAVDSQQLQVSIKKSFIAYKIVASTTYVIKNILGPVKFICFRLKFNILN